MKKLMYTALSLLMCMSLLPIASINAKDSDDQDDKNSKEETVYEITDANGNISETIVSAWLVNNTDSKTLADKCNLSKVENVKGKETYTSKDGVNTWKTKKGQDIYYQAKTDKECPVKVKITYYLNDKEISAKDILGKSGTVKIKYDYTNNAKEMVDGKEYYVPFMMVSGLMLDGKNFSEVSVDNGKIINDGDRYIAIGYGLPGMKSNLGVSDANLDLDSFTITCKTTNFEISDSLTYASNEVLNDLDTSRVSDLSSLTSQLDELASSADQLESGSKQLNEGLLSLQSKLPILSGGIVKLVNAVNTLNGATNTLANGVNSLNTQYTTLDQGIKSAATGSSQLASGLSQVNSGIDTLVNGQAQLETGVNAVYSGLATVRATIQASINKDTDAATKIQASGGVLQGDVTTQLTTALTNMGTLVATTPTTDPNYQTYVDTYNSLLALQNDMQTVGTNLTDAGTDLGSTNPSNYGSIALQTGLLQTFTETSAHNSGNLADGIYLLQQGIVTLGQGLNGTVPNPGLKSAVNSLAVGSNNLKTGLDAASTGSDKVLEGLSTLNTGATSLNQGANTLSGGLITLASQVPTLTSGVNQLADGSTTLAEGMAKFNAEGIKKLVNLAEGDVKTIVTKLQDVVDAGKAYKSFTGLSDDMDGKVKFIIKTEGIEK